jgi:hypothetical protein
VTEAELGDGDCVYDGPHVWTWANHCAVCGRRHPDDSVIDTTCRDEEDE